MFLPHSCVIQVFMLHGNKRGEAMSHSSRHDTEKTPLRLLLRNRGSVFRCYSSCMAQIRHNIFCNISILHDAISSCNGGTCLQFFCVPSSNKHGLTDVAEGKPPFLHIITIFIIVHYADHIGRTV
jgi:hypothetical protein